MEGICSLLLSGEIILVLGRRTKKQVRMAFFLLFSPNLWPNKYSSAEIVAVKGSGHRSGGKPAGSRVREWMVEEQCAGESSGWKIVMESEELREGL